MSRFYVSAFNLNDIKNLLTVQLYVFKNVFELLYLWKGESVFLFSISDEDMNQDNNQTGTKVFVCWYTNIT